MQKQPKKPYVPYKRKDYLPQMVVNEADINEIFTVVLTYKIDNIKEFISKHNKNLNVKNENDDTLIHVLLNNPPVTANSNITEDTLYDIISYLLQHGVSVNTYNKYNITALHLAAKNQFYKITKLLLDHGADASAVDSQNMTPLHYLSQGLLEPCKNEKKNKMAPLIQKTALKQNEANVTNINKIVSELTLQIINILSKDPLFRPYIDHIKNSTKEIPNIFNIEFSNRKSATDKEVSKLVSNAEITADEKKQKLNDLFSAQLNEINKFMLEEILKQSLDSLLIAPNQVDGWKPTEAVPSTDASKILNHKDINEKIIKIEENIYSKVPENVNMINALDQEMKNIINNDLYDEIIGIFYSLHNIVQFNHNHNLNYIAYGIKPKTSIDDKKIANHIFSDSGEKILYQEINFPSSDEKDAFVNVDYTTRKEGNPKMIISFGDDDIPSIVHATQEKQKKSKKKLKPAELSVGVRGTIFPAITFNHALFNTNDNITDKTKFFANDRYFYVSNILFAIESIKKHFSMLSNNVNTLKNNYSNKTNKYFMEMYYPMITEIIISMGNILQYILFIKANEDTVKQKTQKIIDLYANLFSNYSSHRFSYLFEYAQSEGQKIKDLFTKILENINKLYDDIYKLQNALNNIIIFINDMTGLTFIKEYNKNITPVTLFDIFDRHIRQINIFPQSLSDYSKKFQGMKLAEIRKLFYEEYIPIIDNNNYSTFYGSLSGTNILISTAEKDTKGYYIPIIKPYTIIPNPIPQIGYLVPNDPIGILTNFEQPPIIREKKSFDTSKLKDADVSLTGYIGYNNAALVRNKPEPVLHSINHFIDDHFYILKYYLAQEMIQLFADAKTPEIKALKDKMIDSIKKMSQNISDENSRIYLYVSVGKITDRLITSLIKRNVGMTGNQFIKPSLSPLVGGATRIFVDTDANFTLDFNDLITDITNFFTVEFPYESSVFKDLTYSVPLMQPDTEQDTKQYPLYSQNYTNPSETNCYKVDTRIVKLLVNTKPKIINHRDSSKSSPIFYAIEMLNTELIDELIKNGAMIYHPTLVNQYGYTPLSYGLKFYNDHLSIIGSDSSTNILSKFYKNTYDEIISEIKSKPDNKNNVIRYLDIVFPQMLIMYNNMFYYYMMRYINNFTENDLSDVIRLLDKYSVIDEKSFRSTDIALIKDLTYDSNGEILTQNSTSGVLVNTLKSLDNNKMGALLRRLGSIEKEIKEMDKYKSDPRIVTYIKKLEDDKTALKKEISDLDADLANQDKQRKKINDNITQENKRIMRNMKREIKLFIDSGDYLRIQNVTKLYDDIFKKVISRTAGRTTPKTINDYMLYNELWKMYISDQAKLINPTNIHLLLVILQTKMSNQIQTFIKDPAKIREISTDFTKIDNIYTKLFIPLIETFMYNSPEYNTENYVMTEVINIITHIVSHVICANLYHAIMKTIAAYASSNIVDKNEDIQTKYKDMSQILEDVSSATYNGYANATLEEYIINVMPLRVVKFTLKIWENEHDDDQKITSLDDIIDKPIQTILDSEILASPDGAIKKNLENIIFPYYRDIINTIIANMYKTIANYNRFILNEGRHINILHSLLDKAALDIKY